MTKMTPNHREAISAVSSVTSSDEYLQSTAGALNVAARGTLVSSNYDYMSGTYPDAVTEIFVYKLGGSGGSTVATVTFVYTDSTKANISTITRT